MALLQILSGNAKGQKIEIDRDEVTIGRAPDSVVPIVDPSVSSRHCIVHRQGRRFTVRDLESTNGTRLNNVRIVEHRLSPKDVITVGSIDILFDGEDVDSNEAGAIPETIVTSPIRLQSSTRTGEVSSAFGAKRDSRRMWVIVFVLIGLVAIGALVWFVMNVVSASRVAPPH